MPLADWLGFRAWIVVIQFVGALLITGYAVAAVVALARTRSVVRARLVMADGVITGLSVMVVGALLRMITLESWQDIGFFAAVFSLRTLLKQLCVWEEARLRRSRVRRPAGQ
jgi:uncharacterized membrane protein